MKASAARRFRPTDKAIPSGDQPSTGTEAQSANHFAAAASEVAQLCAGQVDMAELLRAQGDEAMRQGQEHPCIGFLAALDGWPLRRGQNGPE